MMWSNDPARDWDRHCKEQQAKLDELPICDHCGEHIQDDYYDFGGEIICQECLDNNFKKQI